MKKRIIAITTLMLMAVVPAMSQVFVLEEDEWNNNKRGRLSENDFGVMVPRENVEYDQWKQAPAGEGIMLLAGLAGAYLLGKRKKEQE